MPAIVWEKWPELAKGEETVKGGVNSEAESTDEADGVAELAFDGAEVVLDFSVPAPFLDGFAHPDLRPIAEDPVDALDVSANIVAVPVEVETPVGIDVGLLSTRHQVVTLEKQREALVAGRPPERGVEEVSLILPVRRDAELGRNPPPLAKPELWPE